MTTLAVTVVGADRAGLINLLASTVAANNGNWLHSHMANLAGQFAGIVQIEVAASSLQQMHDALNALSAQGLQISIAAAASTPATAEGRLLTLELLGQDHPGIIRDITSALALHQISVEELETDSFSGSMSGEKMFSAKARLIVPASVTVEDLDNALQELSNSLMVDVTLDDADSP